MKEHSIVVNLFFSFSFPFLPFFVCKCVPLIVWLWHTAFSVTLSLGSILGSG